MMSRAARYERGEHEEVWRELRAMGPRALDPPYREDSAAVAHAMALRARRNVDVLVSRLSETGFVFRDTSGDLAARPAHIPPTADAAALVTWLEHRFGPVPLTIGAWIREVGDVWLVGDHPRWPEADLADPLVVEFEYSAYSGHDIRAYYEDEWRDDAEWPFQLDFAPDDFHKANISGGAPYGVRLPEAAVDGWCDPPHQYFVDHLNTAFAAGGFPGALVSEGFRKPPAGLRQSLAKDLWRL